VAYMRVVSLLPSATEMVCAIGAAPALVGVSHECDFPPEVRARPKLTATRLGPPTSSAAVHAEIEATLREALSPYLVDVPALRALSPDLVITQHLCAVCAVAEQDLVEALAGTNTRLLSLEPRTLDGVLGDVERVGEALGLRARGAAVSASLRARFEALGQRTRELPRRRVALVEWLDPIMLGGLWMPELVELAGGVPVGPGRGEEAITVSAVEAEVVVLKPCGFSVEQIRAELPALEWLPARDVWIVDGHQFFNRPGPRLLESAEILAAILHPERFGAHPDAHRVR